MNFKQDYLEQIKDVVEITSAEQGEYSNINDRTPLEKFIGMMVESNKFDNRQKMYQALNKIAIKEDKDTISEFATNTYKKLSDGQKDAVHYLMLAMTDYKNEETSYAKHLVIAEKVLGLIKISGKDIEDYKEERELFQDKACWSMMNGEDISNFPQYITQMEPIKQILDGMDVDYFKTILDLIDENDDSRDEIIKLVMIADIGVTFIRMFKNLSEISSNFSTVKSGALFKNVDSEDDDVDLDDLTDTIVSFLTSKLNLKKSKAEDISEDIVDLVEDEKEKDLKNLGFLFEGKPKALFKDREYKIVSALKIVNFYLLDDLSQEDKVEATRILLPLAYISAMTDTPFSEFIDLGKLRDYIDEDMDDEFDDEDFDADMEDMELSEAVALDYLTGSYLATHYLGVHEDQDFYIQLAKMTIPNLSYSYFESRMSSSYEDKVTVKSIKEILEKDYAAYSDRTDLIHLAAKAIYDAIV